MPAPAPSFWRSALVPAAVLGGLLAVALSRQPAPEPGQPAPLLPMDGWSVTDLIGHLEGRGLGLRAVPTWDGGAITVNAFLIRGERPWKELALLPKHTRDIHRWRGVVFCERVESAATAEQREWCWEGGCLRAGPFVFFGDPHLLMLIHDALHPTEDGEEPR